MNNRSSVMSALVTMTTLFLGASAVATGCVAPESSDDEEALGQAPQAAAICPQVWEPVCGKDGTTYSNECEAGGPGKVAYEGECVDPCAAVLCIEGTECVVRGKKPFCLPVQENPCAAVLCLEGTQCVVKGNHAVCVPASTTTCASEDCGPAILMPNTLCSDGVTVSGPTGECLASPGGTCAWEVIECP